MSRSRKAQVLDVWTKDIAFSTSQFKMGVELMIRKHQKSNNKNSSWAISLKEMAEKEASGSLRSSLEALALGLNEIEQSRLDVLSSLQHNVISQFAKYESRFKVAQSNIAIRNKEYLKFNKKQADYLSSRGRAKQKVQDHKKALLEEEKKRLQSSEDIINSSVGELEAERVSDMKSYLKHYLNAHIFFYARALEIHAEIYKKVISIEPEQERVAFIRALKQWEQVEQQDDIGQAGSTLPASGPSPFSPSSRGPFSPSSSPFSPSNAPLSPSSSPFSPPTSPLQEAPKLSVQTSFSQSPMEHLRS